MLRIGQALRARAHARDPERGASAVEFALVSVLLLTLLFGILQYGYFFFQQVSNAHAAREGARQAAVGLSGPYSTCANFKNNFIKNRSGAATSGLAVAVSTVPASNPQPGDEIDVTVTYHPTKFGFPFVPFISGTTESSTGKARIEVVGTWTSGSC